tara:strand:+ start:1410 stop:1880 length:471 start_codon:yes stop_codon:yes gene_type:complete
MIGKTIITVMTFGLGAIFLIIMTPTIFSHTEELRTNPVTDTGSTCTTGGSDTTCIINLSKVHAFDDNSNITVTETSPSSADWSTNTTLQSGGNSILISGLTSSTSYVFNISFFEVDSLVDSRLNQMLRFVPLGVVLIIIIGLILGITSTSSRKFSF